MSIELDHVFICCDAGGAEGDALVQAGFTEGSAHRHRGQGTANRRFFFRNAYLELLWVHSKREARGDPAWRTQLWERWDGRNDSTCPFGVAWRPARSGVTEPPFATWDYRPAYLPSDARIRLAEDNSLLEPLWFFVDQGKRPDSLPRAEREPIGHAQGVEEITGVVLVDPGASRWSKAGLAVRNSGLISIVEGPRYCLELQFDGCRRGREVDCRPGMPLVLRW